MEYMHLSEEVQRTLGRLESKVDVLLSQNFGFDKRIGALEKNQWRISGGVTVLVFLIGLAVKVL